MIDKKMGSSLSLIAKKYKGFTLAEILLSLSIIGIVAAIALPSLLGNVHERAFETQKKALYTRFSQGLSLLPSLNGYGQLEGTFSEGTKGQEGYVPQSVTVDTAAETFIRDGLSKVMKITNICDSEHLTDCGLPDKIIPVNGGAAINLSSIKTLKDYNPKIVYVSTENNSYEQLDTKVAAFETVNGESVLVYYNPNCEPDLKLNDGTASQPKICANFIYDLNGKKGPNTVGKDIGFITSLYSTDPVVVAPNAYASDYPETLSFDEAILKCKELDGNGKLPNVDELISMFYNMKITNIQGAYWTNAKYSPQSSWRLSTVSGNIYRYADSEKTAVRCIKR